MMGDDRTKPQDQAVPDPVEQDGTGGDEVSGAGYGNNAGYQGGADRARCDDAGPGEAEGGTGVD